MSIERQAWGLASGTTVRSSRFPRWARYEEWTADSGLSVEIGAGQGPACLAVAIGPGRRSSRSGPPQHRVVACRSRLADRCFRWLTNAAFQWWG